MRSSHVGIASIVLVALMLSGCSDTGATKNVASALDQGVSTSVEPEATTAPLEIQAGQPINNTAGPHLGTCNRPAGQGVMLSFDDYGTPDQVRAILGELKSLNWKAMFFPTGEWALGNWDLIRLIQEDGHILGGHSMTHPDLVELLGVNVDEVYREMYPLKDYATTDPLLFRPPYGSGLHDPKIAEIASGNNMQLCGWTADTNDWRAGTAEDMLASVMNGHEGSALPLTEDGVVLAHLHGEHSVAFIRLLAAELERKGWPRAILVE